MVHVHVVYEPASGVVRAYSVYGSGGVLLVSVGEVPVVAFTGCFTWSECVGRWVGDLGERGVVACSVCAYRV